jgi:hypothetical protein
LKNSRIFLFQQRYIGSVDKPVKDGQIGIYFASMKVEKMRGKVDWFWNYLYKRQRVGHQARLDAFGFFNVRRG